LKEGERDRSDGQMRKKTSADKVDTGLPKETKGYWKLK
jgi:hypothetical protein